jgi:long-chain acyl-CoA synthetase
VPSEQAIAGRAELDPRLPRYPSIVQALVAACQQRPNTEALVCQERRLSYAELGRAVAALAARLRESGAAGACVAVLLPTSIEGVVAVLAVLAAGACVVPVNPFFTEPELASVLGEAQPRITICGVEALEKLRRLGPRLGLGAVWHFGPGGLEVGEWLRSPSLPIIAGQGPLSSDPALAIFTGGTTGEPKAVEHRHASLFMSVLQHCSVWPVEFGRERFLSAAPIFHIWGFSYATLVPVYCQSTLVLVPRYQPEAVLEALERERITIFGGGPAPIYFGLTQSPRFAATRFESLKYCLSGGSPVPEELHRNWQSGTGCALLEGWGMSEAAPLCLNRPEGPRKLLSVGRPVPGGEVEAVDLEHGERVLPSGEAGELRVRGPQLMHGYRGKPEATSAVVRDGWLYTGDIGYLDAEGYVFLVDRKKDMIIVGGYNVYPRQVDEVLFRHPAIAEAATVGRPDRRLGEVLVAYVVLRAGAALSEAEFFEYCRSELVKYRRPVAVRFVESLPRTPARKIDKRALRARAAELPLTASEA